MLAQSFWFQVFRTMKLWVQMDAWNGFLNDRRKHSLNDGLSRASAGEQTTATWPLHGTSLIFYRGILSESHTLLSHEAQRT